MENVQDFLELAIFLHTLLGSCQGLTSTGRRMVTHVHPKAINTITKETVFVMERELVSTANVKELLDNQKQLIITMTKSRAVEYVQVTLI